MTIKTVYVSMVHAAPAMTVLVRCFRIKSQMHLEAAEYWSTRSEGRTETFISVACTCVHLVLPVVLTTDTDCVGEFQARHRVDKKTHVVCR